MKNYKLENALLSMKKDSIIDYEKAYQKSLESVSHPLYNDFVSLFNSKKDTIYIIPKIDLGDIKGYKNTKADYISIGSSLTFHFNFEIEHPNQTKIDELKKERDGEKYSNLTDDEFSLIENEFNLLLDKISAINTYISDFNYAYIQEIPNDKLNLILNHLKSEESINLNNEIHKLYYEKHNLLYKLDERFKDRHNFSEIERFEIQKKYWRVYDQYEDLRENRKVTDEIISERNKKYNITFEEHKVDVDKWKKYFDNL